MDAERVLALALTRLVEVVGEAAGRVSSKTRDECPAVPWSEVISMRNRLIHGYDDVDLDILWDTVEIDFPGLVVQLEDLTES